MLIEARQFMAQFEPEQTRTKNDYMRTVVFEHKAKKPLDEKRGLWKMVLFQTGKELYKIEGWNGDPERLPISKRRSKIYEEAALRFANLLKEE